MDEYEAGQQTKTTEDYNEASLDQIPEWNQFVTNGRERGLDVMAVLEVCRKSSSVCHSFFYVFLYQSPQLLQNPTIEMKFRSLLDCHPPIKALFRMMEFDV